MRCIGLQRIPEGSLSFIHLFIHSFIHSFVRSFVHSLIQYGVFGVQFKPPGRRHVHFMTVIMTFRPATTESDPSGIRWRPIQRIIIIF